MSRIPRSISVLALILAVVLTANILIDPQTTRPNWEYWPEMSRTPAFRPYSSNPFLKDRKTLQQPVEGTVAKGHLPFNFDSTPEDAARAGEELKSPTLSEESASFGRAIFNNFCIPCHGSQGMGDGTVTQRGFPAPPSLKAEHARGLKDGQIFHILTFGQGNMPPYQSLLTRKQRWQVISHVRRLQSEETEGE